MPLTHPDPRDGVGCLHGGRNKEAKETKETKEIWVLDRQTDTCYSETPPKGDQAHTM